MSTKPVVQAEREFPTETDRVDVPRKKSSNGGALIINADDWGRDSETTQRILECALRGSVSSVSAMVFMEDSERGAELALERGIDAGFHLNLTTPFSGTVRDNKLIAQQEQVSRHLRKHRLASALFHPGLAGSFKYVVQAQLEEFRRLYGEKPKRIDGHHHMHLCANVLLGGLLPEGTNVRRNFTFASGEKSIGNRLYRKIVDHILSRRHHLTDYFFSLLPIERPRIENIFSLGRQFTVEVETHPVNPEEYDFLTRTEVIRRIEEGKYRRSFDLAARNR